jgi:hypothetical protein
LEAFWAASYIELYRLAFLKAAETVRLDCREMYENVFAILAADEAKSLCVVKPLHCSLFHCVVPVSEFLAEKIGAADSG